MARKSLDTWIHEVLTDNEPGGKCTRIVLSHMVGMGRTEITTHKLSDKGSYVPKNLADMFIGKADAYCQDMKGENRFMLDAYYSTAEAIHSQPFSRVGQPENRTGMLFPATEEGRLMQRMEREADLTAQVFKRQERQDAREDRNAERIEQERLTNDARVMAAHNHISTLMESNMKMFEMCKEMMASAILRQDEREMKKLEYIRATQREAAVMKAAPVFANMALGREVFPQSMVDTEIIESIASELTPDAIQMIALLPGVSDEKKGILMHRLNQAREKLEREEEHRKQLPVSSMSGEEELAGKGEPH